MEGRREASALALSCGGSAIAFLVQGFSSMDQGQGSGIRVTVGLLLAYEQCMTMVVHDKNDTISMAIPAGGPPEGIPVGRGRCC